jgi:TPR repeat protein
MIWARQDWKHQPLSHMPKNEQLPATVPTNSTLPQAQSSSLVARGLAAIQQSLSVPEKEDAESLFKTGMRYRNDESGDPQNSDHARAYLLQAANLNHAEAQFELCVLLGEYYEWPEAVAWLEESVALGFGPAQLYLAQRLTDPELDSLIVDHLSNQNYDGSQLYRQASAWYEERAKAGDPEAQFDFAWMHRNEEATNYSPEEAIRWMKAAAEQDHGFACMRLGEWLLDVRNPKHNTDHGI